jgi:hypothetical protein
VSVTETVLYFVVIPGAAVLAITGLAMAGGGRSGKRYRPGRPYDFTPVWFLSSPEQLNGEQPAVVAGQRVPGITAAEGDDSGRAVGSDVARRGLAAGAGEAGSGSAGVRVPAGSTGGASDRW